MDDAWFEQAVAEMTQDSQHLIAGFAWGLKYDKPTTWISLKTYILEDPTRFITNWWENQKKLYTKNLPQIILWDAGTLYLNKDSSLFYKNILFLITLLIPLILLIIWIINLVRNNKKDILIITGAFFFIASVFFTLFFTLNRYFLILLPLFLLIIVYWIQTLNSVFTFSWTGFTTKNLDKNNFNWKNILKIIVAWAFVSIYCLGIFSYYNSHKHDDEKYTIKKEAGEWLKDTAYEEYIEAVSDECNLSVCSKEILWKDDFVSNLDILERFPVVTYYSWTLRRWITPYTDSLNDLITYAEYNDIDYLIVDTLDFKLYRPELHFLLDENKEFEWLERIKVLKKDFLWEEQMVIIYKIKNKTQKN